MNRFAVTLLTFLCAYDASTSHADEPLTKAEDLQQLLVKGGHTELAKQWQALIKTNTWKDVSGQYESRAKYLDHARDMTWVQLRTLFHRGKKLESKDVKVNLEQLGPDSRERVRKIDELAHKVDSETLYLRTQRKRLGSAFDTLTARQIRFLNEVTDQVEKLEDRLGVTARKSADQKILQLATRLLEYRAEERGKVGGGLTEGALSKHMDDKLDGHFPSTFYQWALNDLIMVDEVPIDKLALLAAERETLSTAMLDPAEKLKAAEFLKKIAGAWTSETYHDGKKELPVDEPGQVVMLVDESHACLFVGAESGVIRTMVIKLTPSVKGWYRATNGKDDLLVAGILEEGTLRIVFMDLRKGKEVLERGGELAEPKAWLVGAHGIFKPVKGDFPKNFAPSDGPSSVPAAFAGLWVPKTTGKDGFSLPSLLIEDGRVWLAPTPERGALLLPDSNKFRIPLAKFSVESVRDNQLKAEAQLFSPSLEFYAAPFLDKAEPSAKDKMMDNVKNALKPFSLTAQVSESELILRIIGPEDHVLAASFEEVRYYRMGKEPR